MKIVEGIVKNLSRIFERVVVISIQFSVGILILDLNIAVLFRYVFKMQMVGTSEIALYLLTCITFLGASLGIKNNSMVAITLLLDRFKKVYTGAKITIQLLILLFSLLFFYYGYNWITAPNVLTIKSSVLQIPVWIPYSLLPFSMVLTIIFCCDNIFKLSREKGSQNHSERSALDIQSKSEVL